MSDIIGRIDELVDDQLQQERSGYDHNLNQEKCWHCGRDWHGLPITERIAEMYARRTYDEAYSLADDDSLVLCAGSDFIGPMPQSSTSGLWADGVGPYINAVTIGNSVADQTIRYASEIVEEMVRASMGLPEIPSAEPPTHVRFWDREFNWSFTTPVSDWQWDTDRTRASFTPEGQIPPFMQMLDMMITTEEPRRQVWRIDRITNYRDGRVVVEIRDVQAELAAIQRISAGWQEFGAMVE